MMNVLVTGADGQLSNCLEDLSGAYPDINFTYKTIDQLDITDRDQIKKAFDESPYNYCINCAAYTAVDKAETDSQTAMEVNVLGASYLAEACRSYSTTLIHISTDFIFDGKKSEPYLESDKPNPLGVYGESKYQGELRIQEILDQFYIIRTSWLYSEHGNNFMKTMLRLAAEREELNVVNDQHGTPTYARDLARAIVTIIQNTNKEYGIYHYSNEGETTWFEFTESIFKQSNIDIRLNPIPTSEYPTPAKRPSYSVLDLGKIKRVFPKIEIKNWKDSLTEALINYNMNTLQQTAVTAAIRAGKAIMEVYDSEFAIEYKDDKSPLTLADKNANSIINDHLRPTDVPIISEENKQVDYDIRKGWTSCWVVDPVDGTKEFIKRNGEFTVNIAMVKDGQPQFGVIYVPASRVLYFGDSEKKQAFRVELNDHTPDLEYILSHKENLRAKDKDNVTQVVGSRSHMNDETLQFINKLESGGESVEIVSKGSSLKFCLVAEGKADIYPRFAPTMEWDTAAGQAICNAVGVEVINRETNGPLLYNKENLLNPWFLVKK